MMKNFVSMVLLLVPIACKDSPPEPQIPERVKLTLIDVSVKETYLHIAVSSPASNETLALQRNGATVRTFAAVAETTLADTGLAQTTTYQYSASLQANNTATGTSNGISAQTLAPTSHNVTWQTFLLGDGNNSSLYDVSIVNDTLIYAVGELYLRDSTGAIGDTPYNLAKWDGRTWEIKRVTVSSRFGLITPPLEGIFAFSPTDIWVIATDPIHGDGTDWVDYDIRVILQNSGLTVSKGWGTSSSNMYFVGRAGNIVHFNGSQWQQLVSGTATRINDAWGVVNPVTGKEEVYCPVTFFFAPGDKRVLRITQQTRVDSIPWQPRRNIYSIWSHNGFPLYVCGSTLHRQKGGSWEELFYDGNYAVNSIRGTALNDIVVAGDFGFISHWNGVNWQMVGYDFDVVYGTVALNQRLIVAVGFKNGRAVVALARRN